MDSAEVRASKRANLYAGLLENIKSRGLDTPQYIDKIDEYMQLWDISQMLNDDIELRGTYVEWQNSANQKGTQANKSISERVKVSSQMLSIWIALGFRDLAKATPVQVDDPDEL